MIGRTANPSSSSYIHYGARGIQVYKPWRSDPTAFITWVIETLGPRPPRYSLDRIDVNGNYEPGNLRWASAVEQTANRRRIASLEAELAKLRAENSLLRDLLVGQTWQHVA